jgi:hypothetical protein
MQTFGRDLSTLRICPEPMYSDVPILDRRQFLLYQFVSVKRVSCIGDKMSSANMR